MNLALRPLLIGVLFLIEPGLFAAEPSSAVGPAAPRDIRPDPREAREVWEGWGLSLCWWAKVFGQRDDIADALFTTRTVRVDRWDVPGLGLNIVRYNAGACSWNELEGGRRMKVSKIILPYRQIEGYWLDPKSADPDSPSWDWNVDANQRAMLLKARDRGADRFELFSNAPMWWMCANDNPSGAAGKTEENLLPGQYRNFATYLAAIARRAKDRWGVAFTSVEPFNEPISGYWFADSKQEGLYLSPASQAAFLPLLRAELDRRGLPDLAIAASDETSYTHALKTWNRYDAATKALVAQVNVHGYEGAKGPRRPLHDAVVVRDRKRLWNSEYGEKQADGLQMARCLQLDFKDLRPSAWSYWQALDGGGWGLFDTDMLKAGIKAVNPKYHVLAQYTRHIRPGMTLLDTGDADTVAAYSAAARRLVLVVFNPGPAREARFDLSALRVADGPVESFLTAPKAEARYERRPGLRVVASRFVAALAADSVQTFELENADLPAAAKP